MIEPFNSNRFSTLTLFLFKRYQFFLQIKQDIQQSRLIITTDLAAQLLAYIIQCNAIKSNIKSLLDWPSIRSFSFHIIFCSRTRRLWPANSSIWLHLRISTYRKSIGRIREQSVRSSQATNVRLNCPFHFFFFYSFINWSNWLCVCVCSNTIWLITNQKKNLDLYQWTDTSCRWVAISWTNQMARPIRVRTTLSHCKFTIVYSFY